MRLQLFYPVRPYKLNQAWGILNPIYLQFGFRRHNGIDLALVNGQEIRAPFDCEVVRVGNQPSGGGIFVGVKSVGKYNFDDGKLAFVLIDFLHCQKILVEEGQQISVGDLLAYGDNTGLSTGSHTHMQCRRIDTYLKDIDSNDANNSFDPIPYFNGVYADTWSLLRGLQAKVARLLSYFK